MQQSLPLHQQCRGTSGPYNKPAYSQNFAKPQNAGTLAFQEADGGAPSPLLCVREKCPMPASAAMSGLLKTFYQHVGDTVLYKAFVLSYKYCVIYAV